MKKKIKKALLEYLEAPEAWGDNVQLEVNTADGSVRLNDDEDVDEDSETLDYWPVMDLICMSVENPGQWEIDPDALEEVADTYNL